VDESCSYLDCVSRRAAQFGADPCLRRKGLTRASRKKTTRRIDGGRDRAEDELCAQLAQRGHRYVGQQSDHASRPAVARSRSASHGAYAGAFDGEAIRTLAKSGEAGAESV
jgi:hypothetical protein